VGCKYVATNTGIGLIGEHGTITRALGSQLQNDLRITFAGNKKAKYEERNEN
jgi:epoxyqueuosine reductase QueG